MDGAGRTERGTRLPLPLCAPLGRPAYRDTTRRAAHDRQARLRATLEERGFDAAAAHSAADHGDWVRLEALAIRSAAHATALLRRLLKVEGVPINQQRDWSKWVRPVVRTTWPSECTSASCARRRTVRCVQESQEKDDVKWNDQVPLTVPAQQRLLRSPMLTAPSDWPTVSMLCAACCVCRRRPAVGGTGGRAQLFHAVRRLWLWSRQIAVTLMHP